MKPVRAFRQRSSTRTCRCSIRARAGSTTTLPVQRGIGDVAISWENEAFLVLKEFGADKYEIVVPSLSILAEPPVSIVDKVVKKKGTEAVAKAYLEYLYSDEGQDIAGRNFYRPISQPVVAGEISPDILCRSLNS